MVSMAFSPKFQGSSQAEGDFMGWSCQMPSSFIICWQDLLAAATLNIHKHVYCPFRYHPVLERELTSTSSQASKLRGTVSASVTFRKVQGRLSPLIHCSKPEVSPWQIAKKGQETRQELPWSCVETKKKQSEATQGLRTETSNHQ